MSDFCGVREVLHPSRLLIEINLNPYCDVSIVISHTWVTRLGRRTGVDDTYLTCTCTVQKPFKHASATKGHTTRSHFHLFVGAANGAICKSLILSPVKPSQVSSYYRVKFNLQVCQLHSHGTGTAHYTLVADSAAEHDDSAGAAGSVRTDPRDLAAAQTRL